MELHFAYLEINPLVMLDDNTVVPLDMAAKLDETANFLTAQTLQSTTSAHSRMQI